MRNSCLLCGQELKTDRQKEDARLFKCNPLSKKYFERDASIGGYEFATGFKEFFDNVSISISSEIVRITVKDKLLMEIIEAWVKRGE